MTIFVTSDLHLGQVNAPSHGREVFPDVDQMNEQFIDNWNALVKPLDTVFVVGDLCMGKLDDTLPLAGRLGGTKYLVPGNHDRMWDVAAGGESFKRWVRRYSDEAGVMTTNPDVLAWIGGHQVRLCHFPRTGYYDDRADTRYPKHHPLDDGGWLLHGHTHNTGWNSGERSIHVGVDAWAFRPIHEDQIACIIEGAKA